MLKYLLRFVYQVHSHHICAILAYIFHISSFLILPVRNIIALKFLYELPICTAHQWLHWSLVLISSPYFWIWTFLTFSFMCFCILPALLCRCLSFYFMNYLFYVYTKGIFIQICINWSYYYLCVMTHLLTKFLCVVKPVKKSFSLSSCLHLWHMKWVS